MQVCRGDAEETKKLTIPYVLQDLRGPEGEKACKSMRISWFGRLGGRKSLQFLAYFEVFEVLRMKKLRIPVVFQDF